MDESGKDGFALLPPELIAMLPEPQIRTWTAEHGEPIVTLSCSNGCRCVLVVDTRTQLLWEAEAAELLIRDTCLIRGAAA